MKRGVVERDFDVSGVSGEGTVAEFCISSNGRVIIFWPEGHGYHSSLEDAIKVHGHNGHTRFVILDDPDWDIPHCNYCHSPAVCAHVECPACLAASTGATHGVKRT